MDNQQKAPSDVSQEPNTQQPAISPPSAQTVPESTAPPNLPQSPFKKYIKIFVIVLVTAFVAVAAFVAYYIISIVGGLHSDLSTCSKGRTQLFNRTPSITSEFNAIEFVPNQSSVKAEVTKQQGDCVDSLPTIFATKKYVVATNAGTTSDEISNALVKSGYTPKKDNYPSLNSCSYQGKRYTYTKADQKIDIELTCLSYGAKGEDWRQVPATKATAYLEVAWAYPKN